ncbi:unnamed protein product [Dicrocoelium dendriticum]|nr:unnamed protein product [Dicrocoelium dendriticum]
MLSGYLDSCRMDFILQWRPPGISESECSASELPFLRLILNLILMEGTRAPALDLLLLLLKRKAQPGPEDPVSKLTNALLADTFSFTRLLTIVSSSLDDQHSLTEGGYNALLLASEVIARLGQAMVTRWTDFCTQSSPCECVVGMQFACSNHFTHILNCILRIMNHPLKMISATTNIFWLTALRSPEQSLITQLAQFIPDLFQVWRRGLKKDWFTRAPNAYTQWMRGAFDSDEYYGLLSKYRTEMTRCLSLAADHWPVQLLQLLTSFSMDLVKATSAITDSREPKIHDSSIDDAASDWDTLELLFDQVLPGIKGGFTTAGQPDRFRQIMGDMVRQYLQVPPSQHPSLRGKYLACCSIAIQYVDATHDPELLIPLLTQIFACFRYNPFEASTSPDFGRPKCVQAMHLEAASSFFRLTRANPERIMPHFDAIGSEVISLWADPCSGMMEKCVLLEALIVLCLRLPQPITVQRDLLKQLVTHVTSSWCPSSPTESDPAPMARLLSACGSGGLGLLTALGLDQPISAHHDIRSPYVQLRIALGQNTLALLATSRRLAEPVNSEQLSQITIPMLEPVLSPVVLVLRAFNQLWLPNLRARVDPSLTSVYEMSDRAKTAVLSLQLTRSERRNCDEPKTPIDRIRLGLFEHHENILTITGILFTGLASRLYMLPTDQLALVLHQGCCEAFEHLPEVKLISIIRHVIRPFVRSCPKLYLSTALVPLIPPIVESVVQRLDASWHRFAITSQTTLADDKAVTEELLEERVTRLLSRALMDLLRVIYTFNGCESISAWSDNDSDKLDDIDMAPDSQMSTASSNHGTTDVHSSVGALAHALMASSLTDSQLDNVDGGASCADPLFLCSLAKCLSWPDSVTCAKASQWIPPLIDAMLQSPVTGDSSTPSDKRHLPAPLAESVLFGILCGLHVNGKNTESNLPGLLLAGVRVYTSVDASVACDRLRTVVTKILLNTFGDDSTQSTQLIQSIQNFENKVFNSSKTLPEKAKRELFKKLVQPIIGVPLSRQFCDNVAIAPLAPLVRSKWKQSTRNGDSFPDTFGLCALFSN